MKLSRRSLLSSLSLVVAKSGMLLICAQFVAWLHPTILPGCRVPRGA